jgi:hypothetical protein
VEVEMEVETHQQHSDLLKGIMTSLPAFDDLYTSQWGKVYQGCLTSVVKRML